MEIRRRCIDKSVDDDVADFRAVRRQQPQHAATACRRRQDVADDDVVDSLLAHRIVVAQNLRGMKLPVLTITEMRRNARQGDDIVACRSRDIGDDDVMAAVSQIDTVLILHVVLRAVDDARHARLEFDVVDICEGAVLQRNAPCVLFDNADVFNRQMMDVRHENADVPPVAFFGFALLAGVRAVGMAVEVVERRIRRAAEILRAWAGDEFAAVARRTRMIGAFQNAIANAADMDVADHLRIFDAQTAVRTAEEVVAAFVRQLDAAVLQQDGRVFRQEDGAVQQPPVAFRLDVGHTRRNDDDVAIPVADGLLYSFVVRFSRKIVDRPHGILLQY